jgi:hypothetical protein
MPGEKIIRMSTTTVFFSWQSDRPTREGRNLIEAALDAAVHRISQDLQVDEPSRPQLQVDSDTRDVPGSPPIFDTIRQKIERAAVFVPDLTFVSQRPTGEPAPNPNVLIEYGYALKCLTYHRIIGVMNKAYGQPSRASLPFDLADHRFPITYDLPEDASNEARKCERDRLAKVLESAVRKVLDSEEYKSSLPKPPVVPPVKYREPLQGRARFRPQGEPIGFSNDPVSRMTGKPDWPVTLADGPAIWLRVMPQRPTETALKISELQRVAPALGPMPLLGAYSNILSVRGGDGAGLCMPLGDGPSPGIVFLFTDGEIWMIDTYPLAALPKLISLDESKFARSLQESGAFLNDRLGIPGPYRWVAGLEGVKGRSLAVSNNRFGGTRGPCTVDPIEEEGTFEAGEDPAAVLEPFFEKVFESCGVVRPHMRPPPTR